MTDTLRRAIEGIASTLAGWHRVATADGDHAKADIYEDVGKRIRAALDADEPADTPDKTVRFLGVYDITYPADGSEPVVEVAPEQPALRVATPDEVRSMQKQLDESLCAAGRAACNTISPTPEQPAAPEGEPNYARDLADAIGIPGSPTWPELLEALGTHCASERAAGAEAGRGDVLEDIRARADEWRNGASSVKGHHLPLKHVYRWLEELEPDDDVKNHRGATGV